MLLNQAGKNTHEHICELLELFARGSDAGIPGRANPELLKWKQKVLNREIELDEIDTVAVHRTLRQTGGRRRAGRGLRSAAAG